MVARQLQSCGFIFRILRPWAQSPPAVPLILWKGEKQGSLKSLLKTYVETYSHVRDKLDLFIRYQCTSHSPYSRNLPQNLNSLHESLRQIYLDVREVFDTQDLECMYGQKYGQEQHRMPSTIMREQLNNT